MTGTLSLLIMAGLFLAGSLLLLRRQQAQAWKRDLVAYWLGFPRGLERQIVAFTRACVFPKTCRKLFATD